MDYGYEKSKSAVSKSSKTEDFPNKRRRLDSEILKSGKQIERVQVKIVCFELARMLK
jgi:hypothetical protein